MRTNVRMREIGKVNEMVAIALKYDAGTGYYKDYTGLVLWGSPEQQATTNVPEYIFYGGQWVKAFNNFADVPDAYFNQKVAIPRQNVTANQIAKGGAGVLASGSAEQQTPWIVAIKLFALVAGAIIFGVIVMSIWNAFNPSDKAVVQNYYCDNDASCTITSPVTPPAGDIGITDIITYAVAGLAIIGVAFVGYKVWTGRKKPVKEVVVETGRSIVALPRKAYQTLRPEQETTIEIPSV